MVGGGLGTVLSTTAPICSTKRPSRKIASILHSLLDCNLPQMYASERNGNIPHMIFVSLFFYTGRILLSKFCHPKVRKSRQISVKKIVIKSTNFIDYTHSVCKFTIISCKKVYTRIFFTQAPVIHIISEIFMYE